MFAEMLPWDGYHTENPAAPAAAAAVAPVVAAPLVLPKREEEVNESTY
jgi:hypothetical protein